MNEVQLLIRRSGLRLPEMARLLDVSERTARRYADGSSKPRRPMRQVLLAFCESRDGGSDSADTFRFIDLFAGIGGLRRGFDSIGGRCVFTSE